MIGFAERECTTESGTMNDANATWRITRDGKNNFSGRRVSKTCEDSLYQMKSDTSSHYDTTTNPASRLLLVRLVAIQWRSGIDS